MEAYRKLEVKIQSWSYVPHAVACSSGTAALHLALESLALSPGSRVIVPNFTMVACARAVTLAGLEPVFVDCDKDLNLNLDGVDEACSKCDGISAIMAVHIYGRCCDMTGLHALANKYGLQVIEDLAEAHGVSPHPMTTAACWSFYKNKIVAGEEGGAVAFNDPGLADRARQLRCLGFTEAHDFQHIPRGHNYRLANSLAEIILRSFSDWELKKNLDLRRTAEGLYNRYCPTEWKLPDRQSPWVYDLRIPGLTVELQNLIIRNINSYGLAARHGFKPMSSQPEYQGCYSYGGSEAVTASREVIYLPLRLFDRWPLAEDSAKRAFNIIRRCVGVLPV